jgi:hypothetical protein
VASWPLSATSAISSWRWIPRKEARAPRKGFTVLPGALPLWSSVVWWPSSVTSPKSETDCDVTPPGDAGPRSSVDDDNAENWAANW